MDGSGDPLTGRGLLRLVMVLAVCAAPAVFADQIAPAFEGLYARVDLTAPYFTAVSPVLVYVWMPLVVLGSAVLLLAPGLLFVLALNRSRSMEEWFLKGFAVSLVGVSAVTQVVQAALGEPVVGLGFIATVVGCAAAAGIFLRSRVGSGAVSLPPTRGRVIGLALVPILFLVVFVPKFFWEAFNGDGAHAYEASRLLLTQATPFWPWDTRVGGTYPGINTFLFTYPTAWFIRLFGPYEIAARLPLVLYLAALYAAIIAVASAGRPSIGAAGRALVWASVVSFALVMSFSATYDPYCADIALPATQDTLLMVCFLGAVMAFGRRQLGWLLLFLLLSLFCSPNGVPMALALLVGVVLTHRQERWRAGVSILVPLAAAAVSVAIAPWLIELCGQNPPGAEHTSGNLFKRFRFLVPFDVSRLALLAVPGGIYVVFGALAWRRLDDLTRALWLTSAMMFGLYYPMAFVSLHYFVPAMVLPIVAYWRHQRVEDLARPRLALAGCWVAVAAAIWLAMPTSSAIHVASREVGELIEVLDAPDYAEMEPGYLEVPLLLNDLVDLEGVPILPMDVHPEVPGERYGGSAFAWNYYANRATGARVYWLVGPGESAPSGTQLAGSAGETTFHVSDPAALARHRAMRPLDSNGRALFQFSRHVLFKRWEAFDQHYTIDLREWQRWLFGDG